MFEEMKSLANREPSLSPKAILTMATVNGARALGLEKQVGELAPKAYADMIGIPFSGRAGEVWNAVLHHHNKVSVSMIGGKWTIPPAE
jgi:imidazolonepropionase-like amidohydrolase